MNIEKAKEIFFKYNGSHFSIDRELGNEYDSYKVPKEIEVEWLEEIKKSLYNKIYVSKGSDRIAAINSYIQLLDKTDAIQFLIKFTYEVGIDTFSLIIVCETLKQYLNNNFVPTLKEDIIKILFMTKEKMLEKNIDIDESFKICHG